MGSVLLLFMRWQAVDGNSLCVLRLVGISLDLLSTRRYENPLARWHTHIIVPEQQPFFIPAPAWGRDEPPAYVLGLCVLPNGCFISPLRAQPHWKLSLSPKLGVLSWCVDPFPAYDGTASVLMSRAVVAMVGFKTSCVCRSSVRSIRGDTTFLHFMSVWLNDSGHLCTCKLGHFFSFLLLLALARERRAACSVPFPYLLFSQQNILFYRRLHFSDILLPQWMLALHSVCLLSTKSAYHVTFPVVFLSV